MLILDKDSSNTVKWRIQITATQTFQTKKLFFICGMMLYGKLSLELVF